MESGSRGCNTGGGEESELGGASFHPTLQVTRETLSSRAGATVLFQFVFNWRPRFGIWSGNCLIVLSVTRMEVPPLDSDLHEGAGEEVYSPAGGARGVGGVVVGGVQIRQHQDCDSKHFYI